MAYRTGNYTAFYVNEPFNESNLGASATKDFVTYNLLRAWKGKDASFPFVDSHDKNYNVRDDSDWEQTLKPRLHDRLNKSKNIILILSSITKNSRALREEIDFGVNTNGLPVIVIYPEYSEKGELLDYYGKNLNTTIKSLWDNLPSFRDSMNKVPTIHIPNNKALIEKALNDPDFNISTVGKSGVFLYKL
jgi:hypothetical protein